ncbi:MAG: hypothetical protein FH756_17210 [Firmicutes bacterium]|nr:hypothetical protein [Bacillota bacterium]
MPNLGSPAEAGTPQQQEYQKGDDPVSMSNGCGARAKIEKCWHLVCCSQISGILDNLQLASVIFGSQFTINEGG